MHSYVITSQSKAKRVFPRKRNRISNTLMSRDFGCFYMPLYVVLGRYESLRLLRNDDVMIT